MLVLAPSVRCKNPNCPVSPSILLPYPYPVEVFEGPPNWPNDAWGAYIACYDCGFVYTYSKQDVRWVAFGSQFLNQLHAHRAFYSLKIRCAEERCQLPIEIHTYTGLSTTIGEAREKVENGNARQTVCPAGHPVRQPLEIEVGNISGPIESHVSTRR